MHIHAYKYVHIYMWVHVFSLLRIFNIMTWRNSLICLLCHFVAALRPPHCSLLRRCLLLLLLSVIWTFYLSSWLHKAHVSIIKLQKFEEIYKRLLQKRAELCAWFVRKPKAVIKKNIYIIYKKALEHNNATQPQYSAAFLQWNLLRLGPPADLLVTICYKICSW